MARGCLNGRPKVENRDTELSAHLPPTEPNVAYQGTLTRSLPSSCASAVLLLPATLEALLRDVPPQSASFVPTGRLQGVGLLRVYPHSLHLPIPLVHHPLLDEARGQKRSTPYHNPARNSHSTNHVIDSKQIRRWSFAVDTPTNCAVTPLPYAYTVVV